VTLGAVLLAPGALALPEDADQPIHIRANSAEMDQEQGLVIYRGDVQVDQGTLRVMADEMTVEYEDQEVIRITAKGEPARYQQQIEVDEEVVRARSSTIIYHTRDERIDLVGNAFLTQEGNEITGDLIEYDIVAGKVDAKAESETPVRMILQPARKKPDGG
jgi:lipopolysaccharide export system protein LptA